MRAVYGRDWRSGIGLSTVVYPMSWVLLRSWLWRALAPAALADEKVEAEECASAS